MHVGLIGYGRRGRALLQLLQALPEVTLSAIGDVDTESRASAATECGVPVFDPCVESWPAGAPDVAVIATPPVGRVHLLERIAASGVRAVLTEKPLALTLAEADRMLEVCAASGVRLGVAHHWRYCPALQRLKQLMDEQRLGSIESIHAMGFGRLLDQGWHLLDAARWLLGGAIVQWAAAHGADDRVALLSTGVCPQPPERDPHHPGPAWACAELTLDGDVRMWLQTGPLLQRTNAPLGDWHERRLRIIGTRGSAECRPGHYLRLQIPGDDAVNLAFDPQSLEVASREMLRDFCHRVGSGEPLPIPGNDARRTLEGLLLCGVSIRDGVPAAAPLGVWENPLEELEHAAERPATRHAPPRREADRPRFSVLIPLVEHRGFGDQCLAGWLAQERFDDCGYELLALDDGSEIEVRRQFIKRLRPCDRIITEPGANRSRLYDAGARAARGEFVLFTESHCVPDADCLCELDRFLRAHQYDGACCRSVPVCYNRLALADALQFESGFREFRRDDDWRKVNVHGFALRRDLYELVGGLKHRFDLFAEMVLAADLRDAGVRLGYAAAAAVNHHYRATQSELADLVDRFVWGELLYRREGRSIDRIGFSFLEIGEVALTSPLAMRECLRTEWRRLRRGARRGDFSAAPHVARSACDLLMAGTCGDLLDRSRFRTLALRCWLAQYGGLPGLLSAYQRVFAAAIRRSWRSARNSAIPTQRFPDDLDLDISAVPEDWAYGFYPAEPDGARTFRWSGPNAGIDLPLRGGEHEVFLETGCIRPWPASLRWTLRGKEISPEQITYNEAGCRLRLTVPTRGAVGRQTLGWSCLPWDVSDPRRLGLPVFGVASREIVAATNSQDSGTGQPLWDRSFAAVRAA